MLEEQGRGQFAGLLQKALRFFTTHLKNVGRSAEQAIIKNVSESGRKTVKDLVKKGRDLELSETIQSKTHLKAICYQCKKEGIAFAIKKTDDGHYRLLYQRKDSALVLNAVKKVVNGQMKPKKSITDILKANSQIGRDQPVRNTPVKHREVNAR